MKITSAKFVKGVKGSSDMPADKMFQVAFIGRSNVGKSSVINALTNQNNLAKTSSSPGRTTEINLFLINNSFYLVDLPGYGFAKTSLKNREKLRKLIRWYLIESGLNQKKVFLIIDAELGPTKADMEVLANFEETNKNIVVIANKIDKLKSSDYERAITGIKKIFTGYRIIPFSAKKKIGIKEL